MSKDFNLGLKTIKIHIVFLSLDPITINVFKLKN